MQKYIIIDNSKPVVFDNRISHKDIAGNSNVTSAGFVDRGKCFGHSDSLNISSSPADYKLIKFLLKTC